MAEVMPLGAASFANDHPAMYIYRRKVAVINMIENLYILEVQIVNIYPRGGGEEANYGV